MLYESPRGISEIHYYFPILFDHRILLAPTYHLFNNTHQHLINLMIYLNTYILSMVSHLDNMSCSHGLIGSCKHPVEFSLELTTLYCHKTLTKKGSP